MSVICLIDEAPDPGLRCFAVSEAGVTEVAPEAASCLPGPVIAVVPGPAVPIRSIALPPGAEARARAAARFALEDDLASELETLHVALGPKGAEGRLLVAIVETARMTRWRAALAAVGLGADRMIPETLCLAPGESALFEGRALVRGAAGDGFAIEPELLPEMLDSLPPLTPLAADALAARAAAFDGFSLLQGDYRPAGAASPRWRRTAIRAAGIGALALALWLAVMILEATRHAARDDHYYDAALALARDALPPDTRLVDPVRQLRAAIGASTGDDAASTPGFLALSGLLTRALQAVPAAELVSLRFAAREGAISAEISHPDFADLGRLQDAATAAGGQLSEQGSRREAGLIVSRVQVMAVEAGP